MLNWYTIIINRDAFFKRHPSGVYKVHNDFSKKQVIDEIAQVVDPPLNRSCTGNEIDWTNIASGVEDGYWWVGIARGTMPSAIIKKYNLVRLNRNDMVNRKDLD